MIYMIGIFIIIAYVFQMILGLKQFKDFNQHYLAMRKKGRVAIGVNKGKIKSGTIVLFAVDERFQIVEAKMMQGISSFAKFKAFDQVIGHNLLELGGDHPTLVKENSLTKKAVTHASKSCNQPISEIQENYQPIYSLMNLQILIKSQLLSYKKKIRRS